MRHINAVILLVIVFTGCVSSGPFKQDLGGSRAVIQPAGGVSIVNVCRQVDLNENSIAGTLKPGDSVKVLKRTGSAALVQLENGNTGWIDIKFIRNSQ
jgi:hypothetical protein